MFKSLWNELTWGHRFDDRMKFLQGFHSDSMTQRFEEKAHFWRVKGRRFNFSPEDALKWAIKEYSEEFLRANDDKLKFRQRELHLIAKLMAAIHSPDKIPDFWEKHRAYDKSIHAYQSPFDEDD